MEDVIREKVHQLYWDLDFNCARTMLTCLSELFHFPINNQTMNAAIGMHGAGGFRAQCGLVEGALMFVGIFLADKGKKENEISEVCFQFAKKFTEKYVSLQCFDLRPNGFTNNDPPHACEKLTIDVIIYTYHYLYTIFKNISII